MIPLFSCVMPVKGDRPYMAEALASLESQGMGDDLEIIVQDADVEPDNGQSDALNQGFAKAHGDWLFWLNADDVLLPGALERVKSTLAARDGIDWIAGNQLRIDEEGRVVDCCVGNVWHDWLYRHVVPHVFGPSAFFTRALFEKAGGFDETLHVCMDWDLWIRFMQGGARFCRIDKYLWALRQWCGSKTQRPMSADEGGRQMQEVGRMMCKNGFTVTRGGLLVWRVWRLLNGNYYAEFRDRVRFRGRKAVECAS